MKTTTTRMIVSLAVAAAAGAAIGMLLAPEKGTDLQKRLRDGLKSIMDDMNAILGVGKELIENTSPDADEKLNEMTSNLQRLER